MKEKKTGLALGKFAPLHKGHQEMIETALAEMDEVIVIIYNCPETTNIPLNIRANWIRSLYPQVDVIEAWDGPIEIGDTPEIKNRHEAYILEILNGRNVSHFYSSEFYGDHVSHALDAFNRLVDTNRSKIPISGSQIRQNPFQNRKYLDPIVYKDFVIKTVFLGAPSTGKTTIAERMANEFNTVWMPEYGREYWDNNQRDRRLSLNQLVEIAEGHLRREDDLLFCANHYLFIDTNAITTYMFSMYYHNRASKKLHKLADMATHRYDLTFVCDTDIPYDDTWDRSGNVKRKTFQKQILDDLTARKVPFWVLKGNLEDRVSEVKKVLNSYQKFKNRSI